MNFGDRITDETILKRIAENDPMAMKRKNFRRGGIKGYFINEIHELDGQYYLRQVYHDGHLEDPSIYLLRSKKEARKIFKAREGKVIVPFPMEDLSICSFF